MGSYIGVLKAAAGRIGISYKEYLFNLEVGLKWCTLGRHWTSRINFGRNPARSDGLATSCREHTRVPNAVGPSRLEKERKAHIGLKWCSGCGRWLPSNEVPRNECRECVNEYARKKYRTDKRYRQERRQHAHARKRNCDPISPEVQNAAMESTGGLCKYCNRLADTFDHIVPISKAGNSELDNVVPACHGCNSSKKDRDLKEWLERRRLQNEPHQDILSHA